MLAIQDLDFKYAVDPLFEGFNWQVERGDSWTILGPSGCGKTTLLYLLAGLLQPDGGRVLIHGKLLDRPRPETGVVLQDYGLLPWANVRQNIRLGLNIRAFYGPDGLHAPLNEETGSFESRVDYWLNRFNLDAVAHHYPAQISGGQRQRTALARTLVLSPDLLLMDEPFASLDAPTREALQDLTLQLHQEQDITIIVVTHTIEEAAILGSKVIILGQPPNSRLTVYENPAAAHPAIRGSSAYQAACKDLRVLLEARS